MSPQACLWFDSKNVSVPANVTFSIEGERLGMKSLEGQKAPAFNLEGNDGKTHSLEDYRGQNVVLFFYPKDSTPG
jgi:peroxiredoxin